MAEVKEVKVPDIGDFDAVEIVEVLVKPGDRVKAEDSLITLESDKATMDVPSPWDGTVQEVKVSAGDQVGEGAVIVTLELAGDEGKDEKEAEEKKEAKEEKAPEPKEKSGEEDEGEEDEDGEDEDGEEGEEGEEDADEGEEEGESDEEPAAEEDAPEDDPGSLTAAHASPSIRRFARELGVDLSRVEGSGRKGRITQDDVREHVKKRLAGPARAQGGAFALPEMPDIDFSKFGEIERVELSRIRKISAKNLHRAWLHVPHVTQFDEADVTEMEAFRKEHGAEAEKQGFKLTPIAFLMKACVAALRKFPDFNASLDPDGEHLIRKHYFHLGIAVDTDDGLIVPVIRDVDKKGLLQCAREVVEMAKKARDRKLELRDLQGATFSISSLGGIGGTAFTPIVNAPEVAILGASKMETKPVWKDGEWVPSKILPLSLSYDHRVIDGATAARFTDYLARALTDLRVLLL